MPERGGPTTQSGIWYQNTIAALYLGRMLDANSRRVTDRVVRVRVEAPEDVDDVVISAADGHTVYVQAKERISVGDAAWRKLWRDFSSQYRSSTFVRGADRLRLHVGEHHPDFAALREMADRARSSETAAEWLARLTQDQRSLRQSVAAAVFAPPETGDAISATGIEDDEVLRALLGHIDVEVWPTPSIERDLAPYWLPAASVPAHTLLRLLRDRVGGEARVRGTFTAADLREGLRRDDGVLLQAPPSFEALRATVASCGALLRQHKATLGATGAHVPRAVTAEIVAWARAPQQDKTVGLLLDHAGRGKTVIMRDTMLALEAADVPVLAIKADQQLAGVENSRDLQHRLGFTEPTEHVVAHLAAAGRIVVLIDQIDALSLALARDQQAMNVVLDLVGRLREIPAVTILLSCRTFDRQTDPRLKRIEVGQEFTVPLLAEGEVTAVLESLGVTPETLTPATRELLRTPLHLDLYASLARANWDDVGRLRGVASLQELYGLLWDDVVRRPDPAGPAVPERVAVLRAITGRMHQDRRTTAPFTALDALGSTAAQATDWLTSEGVLVRSAGGWTFLHQTFFDYCYARFFVEDGQRLRDAVIASDQGLFMRPQIVQVLTHLRGTGHPEYLRTLDPLLDGTDLRFHLHDLVLRWFGSLPDPNDAEWTLLLRRLLDPGRRGAILAAIRENPAWYGRVAAGVLDSLLRGSPGTIDEQVVPYLGSLMNDPVTQAAISALAQGWLRQQDPWPSRAHWLAQHVRTWHTQEAIALYEAMLERVPLPNLRHAFQLDDIAQADPMSGIRILRRLFDRVLDARDTTADSQRWAIRGVGDALDTLDDYVIGKALGIVGAAAPAAFLDEMLPWLERAVTAGVPPDENLHGEYHRPDPLTRLSSGRSGLRTPFLDACASALRRLAATDLNAFRTHADRLAALPYITPQKLLAHVYRDTMPVTARDALRFLTSDARRLHLGNDESLLTRQLIKALVSHVEVADLAALERMILETTGKARRRWDRSIAALRWRGVDQLHLLRTLPLATLSPEGRDRLGELERKFPGLETPDHPTGERGGWVGPPISSDVLRRMPDSGWLGAMGKYTRGVRHTEFLRGGSRELASQLQALTKEDPRRFAALAARVPADVDDDYVEALIAGLAESDCPPSWVYDLVRRFAAPDRPHIRRRITWALEQVLRRSDSLPRDLMDLLNGWTRGTPGEDEARYDASERDLWHAAINTDRASAVVVLLTALRKGTSEDAVDRQWDLLEFVAQDPSPVLRAAGLHELKFMLALDAERAVGLFERMVRGEPRLRRADPFQEFLYYASREHFTTLLPYLREVMQIDDPKIQQRGAELGVLAHLALRTTQCGEATALAGALAEEIVRGPAEWRRGAAHIYAHNLADYPGDQCEAGLRRLLEDPDKEVRQYVAWLTHQLRPEHVVTRSTFLSAFATSRSVRSALYGFAEYLWEHGSVNPPWALETVEALLDNRHPDDEHDGLAGGDHLVRTALRVYTDPTADERLRHRAMDVFDRLMEHFSHAALVALAEWDRG